MNSPVADISAVWYTNMNVYYKHVITSEIHFRSQIEEKGYVAIFGPFLVIVCLARPFLPLDIHTYGLYSLFLIFNIEQYTFPVVPETIPPQANVVQFLSILLSIKHDSPQQHTTEQFQTPAKSSQSNMEGTTASTSTSSRTSSSIESENERPGSLETNTREKISQEHNMKNDTKIDDKVLDGPAGERIICQFYLEDKCRFGVDCINLHQGEVVSKKKVKKLPSNPVNNDGRKEKKPPMKTAQDVIKRIQWDEDIAQVQGCQQKNRSFLYCPPPLTLAQVNIFSTVPFLYIQFPSFPYEYFIFTKYI